MSYQNPSPFDQVMGFDSLNESPLLDQKDSDFGMAYLSGLWNIYAVVFIKILKWKRRSIFVNHRKFKINDIKTAKILTTF